MQQCLTKNMALFFKDKKLVCLVFQREDKVKDTNEKCHHCDHQGLHGLVQQLGREHGPDEEVVPTDEADEPKQEQFTATKK